MKETILYSICIFLCIVVIVLNILVGITDGMEKKQIKERYWQLQEEKMEQTRIIEKLVNVISEENQGLKSLIEEYDL